MKTPINKEFAKLLDDALTSAKFTPAALSRATNISNAHISRVRYGKGAVTYRTASLLIRGINRLYGRDEINERDALRMLDLEVRLPKTKTYAIAPGVEIVLNGRFQNADVSEYVQAVKVAFQITEARLNAEVE